MHPNNKPACIYGPNLQQCSHWRPKMPLQKVPKSHCMTQHIKNQVYSRLQCVILTAVKTTSSKTEFSLGTLSMNLTPSWICRLSFCGVFLCVRVRLHGCCSHSQLCLMCSDGSCHMELVLRTKMTAPRQQRQRLLIYSGQICVGLNMGIILTAFISSNSFQCFQSLNG